jgi:hypothetical protein
MQTMLPYPLSTPAWVTVPHWAARTGVPVGAAMSSPAWRWPGRLSPNVPVTVPLTGVWMAPEPQPVPVCATGVAATGAAAGGVAAAGVVDSVWRGVTAAGEEEAVSPATSPSGAGAAAAGEDGFAAVLSLDAPGW